MKISLRSSMVMGMLLVRPTMERVLFRGYRSEGSLERVDALGTEMGDGRCSVPAIDYLHDIPDE